MKRNASIIPLAVLSLGTAASVACGSIQALFATPTPTVTNTPTRTPTATPTRTLTPTPSMTPTRTATPRPDISGAVLALEDLPPGFETIPMDQFGLSDDALGSEDLPFETAFGFLEAEHFEFVVGFTALLLTSLERASFDLSLRHPDFLMDSMLQSMGATQVSGQQEIAGMDDIGDASVGITMAIDLGGLPFRTDIAIFRRDIVGCVILLMYPRGETPLVAIDEAATKLDERVVEVLARPVPAAAATRRGGLTSADWRPLADPAIAAERTPRPDA